MYSAIAANKRNSLLLVAIFVALIGAMGWVASNLYNSPWFLYVALGAAGVYAFAQYFFAGKLALAVNGAKLVTKRDAPQLYTAVENICIATGLPMPKVYLMDDPALNAFATGRDPHRASVAATTGLVSIMTKPELEAVVAHEMGHVQNYDIRFAMIVFALVSAVALIADMLWQLITWVDDEREGTLGIMFEILGLVLAIAAPFVAFLVQMAVSRQREYLADSTGVLTTRYPEGLVSALKKIRDHGSTMHRQNTATAHLFFANPLKARAFTKLLSTHPSIEDRIARLEANNGKL